MPNKTNPNNHRCWVCHQLFREGDDTLEFKIYSDDVLTIHEGCEAAAEEKNDKVEARIERYEESLKRRGR